jgi:hypothetical protein
MTTLTQFTGGRNIASIVNPDSSGGTQQRLWIIQFPYICKSYSSSSVAANALQTMLDISGSGGCLNFVAAVPTDATSRTIRIKITIDGRVIFDATSSAITSIEYGIVAIGAQYFNGWLMFQPVVFRSSAKVEIASSVLNDSTKITTYINYETDA